ncbi:MAG: hypothetical protein HOM55_04800 [Proteobacteria bacterium]|nr:hypothetical protein [Pseudomonadota bacterium]
MSGSKIIQFSLRSALVVTLSGIASHPVIAQAPVSDRFGGQGANSSLQRLREMDAMRREMSELRNLIERQGYEFAQFKRKSDQEISNLREQLRALNGGIAESNGALGSSDSGIYIGVPENVQSITSQVDQVNQGGAISASGEPEAEMIDISVGGYRQTSTNPDLGSRAVDLTAVNRGGLNANGTLVTPESATANVRPVTVEVVRDVNGDPRYPDAVNTPPINGPQSQAQQNYGSAQSYDSDLQWQVINSTGPRSTPLEETTTFGLELEDNQTPPVPARSQPSADDVLGDL